MHAVELKFSMYIIGHCQMNPINFGEGKMYNSFYRSAKINSYTFWHVKSFIINLGMSKLCILLSPTLVCVIICNSPTYCISVGEFRI